MRDLTLAERAALLGRLLTTWPRVRRAAYEPRERTRSHQLRALQRLVRHAYENVPLYRQKYDDAGVRPEDLRSLEDLRRFPVVTKDEVVAGYPERTLARGYVLDDLIVSRSSGSSGKVLDVAYDPRAMIFYILAGLRMYQMGFGYRPWHRQTYVYTSAYPMRSLLGLYPLRFVSTLAPVEEILDDLRRHPPDLLACYPSHLRLLLDRARETGVRLPRPRLASVNSEMSSQAERDAMAGELGCPVLDEYSSEELTRIAAQCAERTYHVFEDVNYIEIVDESMRPTDGVGIVVGTNLHNYAMPMIRYVQNDVARLEEAACPCGRTFRTLKELQGRRNDSFTLPSGRTLTSGLLLDATYEIILAHRTAIRDFCLIQREVDGVVLQVVAGPGWSEAVRTDLASRFARFLEPGVRFEVQAVAECYKTTSGKRNPIINLVGRPAAGGGVP